ncbi:MAG TPA: TonB family protein [Oligoflexia bacterium]|nr:TonB family protein [Oligoflexia bacterium]HMR23788.1 TonB family protein [Oligoflexia bacterium]
MEQGILKQNGVFYPQKSKKLIPALIGSVALHVLLMLFFAYNADNLIQSQESLPLTDKVELIQKEQLSQQIVELLQPETLKPNKDSKYLSDRNTFTEKEVRQIEVQKAPKNTQKSKQEQNVKKKYNFSLSPQYILNDIRNQESTQNAPQNYLPDIDIGNETLLNAQKFKYASFFIRMKQQLENVWSPRPIVFQQNLNGKFYSTKLSIRLDQNGYLLSVKIVDSSGSPFLDEEAIRSVQKAAPFMNPPSQLLDQNQQLYIPSWSFIISKY